MKYYRVNNNFATSRALKFIDYCYMLAAWIGNWIYTIKINIEKIDKMLIKE
jgi:hypothetical protein